MMPVGLPCACWQWNTSLGLGTFLEWGSVAVPFPPPAGDAGEPPLAVGECPAETPSVSPSTKVCDVESESRFFLPKSGMVHHVGHVT
uniref:Uncharacterized protein n=1 Tax=Ixodes ricinus TaxID=34613 RepID=A0A6B0UA24_IXORI